MGNLNSKILIVWRFLSCNCPAALTIFTGQYARRPPSPQGVSLHDPMHEFQKVLSHFVCGRRRAIKEMQEHMMPRLYLQDRILKPFNL